MSVFDNVDELILQRFSSRQQQKEAIADWIRRGHPAGALELGADDGHWVIALHQKFNLTPGSRSARPEEMELRATAAPAHSF